MKNKKEISCFLVLLLVVLVIAAYIAMSIRYPQTPPPRRIKDLRTNMELLAIVLDEFSEKTGGYYPADVNRTVGDVLSQLGQPSHNHWSVAGAGKVDSVRTRDIGSKGPALLSRHFSNAFGQFFRTDSLQREYEMSESARPALVTSHQDPPQWRPGAVGIVFYVPLGVNGKVATGFKVYGAGRSGLHPDVLGSSTGGYRKLRTGEGYE